MSSRTRVDVAALIGVARQYEAVADIVDGAVRSHLTGLAFDGAAAGRMHVARGDALRHAVDDVVDQLRQWSRASRRDRRGTAHIRGPLCRSRRSAARRVG